MERRKAFLSEMKKIVNSNLIGEDREIKGLNLCNRKSIYESVISYIANEKYIEFLRINDQVKAVFISEELFKRIKNEFENRMSFFIVEYPEKAFYDLHTYLYNHTEFYDHFNFSKNIGNNCRIHETAFIEDGVTIGDNVVVNPKSVIRRGSIIGNNVTIGCCCVIGAEGFQAIYDENKIPYLIKHVGGVKIEDNVVIGDLSNVCNSLMEGNTFIGESSKIDTHIHIGHNCSIGKNSVLTAGTILCGSAIIKDNVWIAPNSTVLNKVEIGNEAFVGMMSSVLRNVKPGDVVYGVPARSRNN